MKDEVAQNIFDSMGDDYNKIAQKFSDTRELPWYEFKDFLQYIKDGDNVLDAGCGNGRLLDSIAEKKIQYTGLDVSSELVQKARERYPHHTFLVGNITDLSFEDASFDAIFCIATFHHLPSEKYRLQALNEFKRVLKPDGHLIMLNWNYFQTDYWPLMLRRGLNKLLGKYRLGWRDSMRPWKDAKGNIIIKRYIRAFTSGEMKRLLKKSNLQLVQQYYTKKGQRTSWRAGFNLITIARKS